MSRRLKWTVGLLVIMAGLAALVTWHVWPISCRVRVTVTFDTPAGPRSGSAVWQLSAGKALKILPEERSADVQLRGEAIPVELPGNQTVYVLLRQAEGGLGLESPIAIALDPQFTGGGEAFIASVERLRQPAMVGRSATLPATNWPAVVRFGNPADPRSVRYSDAADLAEISPGTRLREVSIEVTRDDPEERIEQRLPWLRGLTKQLDGSSSVFSREPANVLDRRAFKR